jgi:hypothetical protein
VAALGLVCFAPPSQAQARKEVLIITEVGLSHPGMALVTNQIRSALDLDQSFQEEVYTENLDAADLSEDAQKEQRDSLVLKYRHNRMDLIVLVGPDPVRLFAEPSKTVYAIVPIVFYCTVPGQVDQRNTDSRSTGSWFQLDPAKTLDAALRLLPETRQVFVAAGQSNFDRGITALVKAGLNSYENRLDVTYLIDLPVNELQERLRRIPGRSIVLYLSFFKDAQGRAFLNASEAFRWLLRPECARLWDFRHVSRPRHCRRVRGQLRRARQDRVPRCPRDLGVKPPQDIPVVYGPSVLLR